MFLGQQKLTHVRIYRRIWSLYCILQVHTYVLRRLNLNGLWTVGITGMLYRIMQPGPIPTDTIPTTGVPTSVQMLYKKQYTKKNYWTIRPASLCDAMAEDIMIDRSTGE